MGTISDLVEPRHRICQESGHNIWKDPVFRIMKKLCLTEPGTMEPRVQQGQFEPAWGPYRNAHFLVPKKIGE